MMKRFEVQVLLRAGHTQADVAKRLGVSERSVRTIAQEPAVERIDDGVEREHRRIGRPSKAEPFREWVAAIVKGEPGLMSIEILRRMRLKGYGGRKTAMYELIASIRTKAIYGMDVRVPGMLYAVIARCPVPGGTLVEYDSAQAESVPGVRAIVEVPRGGVAVVAENTWSAIRGRAALDITWDEGGNATLSSASISQTLADRINEALADEGATSLTTIEAVYETPYLAHVPLEPVNCVADVQSNRCELWLPTQNPQAVREFVRGKLNRTTDVHVTLLGGGFGRKLEVDFALEAAEVSQAIGGPVQLVWTREDDIRHGYFRQLTVHRLRGGLDAAGTPTRRRLRG